MNKRGISHIEVLLSFLIFVGFILFALYFFSPNQTERLVDSSLSYSFREIKKNTTVELETYSVSLILINPVGSTIAISLPSSGDGNVRAENYLGGEIPSERDGNIADIIHFEWANTVYGEDSGFVTVKISEDIDAYVGGVVPATVDENLYDIGSSNTANLVSEKKIIALKDRYDADYISLKEDLNLPGRVEFGFSLHLNEDEKIETEREILEDVEIFTDKERIEVLRQNGEVVFADLIVKIW